MRQIILTGINTIGFTDIAKSGIHKFKLKDAKNSLSSVRVIKSGRPYLSRKVFVDSSVGISTYKSIVTFKDHGFLDGELVSYQPFVGLGTTSPQSISGLSTTNQYNIIKIDNDNLELLMLVLVVLIILILLEKIMLTLKQMELDISYLNIQMFN
ncbi:MAG: hypothetical protein CM15mL5_1830 [uncultured marine virus]|nr:MAG: hypothetical protein CM15mL5_1830 [uncultured marine virus]